MSKPNGIEFYGGIKDGAYYELVDIGDNKIGIQKFTYDSEPELLNKIQVNESDYLIPPKRVTWSLPEPIESWSDVEEMKEQNAFNLIVNYISRYTEIPSNEELMVCAAWVLATWTKERFIVYPYLHFIAPNVSGKTTAIDSISRICYRGEMDQTPTPAVVAREIENKKITFFFDEIEKDDYKGSQMIPLLCASYKDGQYYKRCEGKTFDVKSYNIAGFKGFGNRYGLPHGLQTRCIKINMEKCEREYPFSMTLSDTLITVNALFKIRAKFFKNRTLNKDFIYIYNNNDDTFTDLTHYYKTTPNLRADEIMCHNTIYENSNKISSSKPGSSKNNPIDKVSENHNVNNRKLLYKKDRVDELFLPMYINCKTCNICQHNTIKSYMEGVKEKMTHSVIGTETQMDILETLCDSIMCNLSSFDEKGSINFPSSTVIQRRVNGKRSSQDLISSKRVGMEMISFGFDQKHEERGRKRYWSIGKDTLIKLLRRYNLDDLIDRIILSFENEKLSKYN